MGTWTRARATTGLRLGKPTFAGNAMELRIGRSSFGLPPGSRVIRARAGRFAWVLTPDRAVHAFVEGGEVLDVPEPLAAVVRGQMFQS